MCIRDRASGGAPSGDTTWSEASVISRSVVDMTSTTAMSVPRSSSFVRTPFIRITCAVTATTRLSPSGSPILKLSPIVGSSSRFRSGIPLTSNPPYSALIPVSYTHLRAHETPEHLVCRLLLEKKKHRV
eukprot:TRINITY_DN31881_c0_g1_i1.p1 TRINITY_DN31881_c0_g1~~TRINITY_DN31881_c0_g1_i1.p1  ORF type:complete len:129 (-),score=15.47 TRINITY_DN31881_c0_g1_i1:18-404(-)